MRTYTCLVLSACLLIAALLAGCGRVEREAEGKITEVLQKRIGPARSYNVDITSPPLRLIKGKIDRLDITAEDVVLRSGIEIALLNVSVCDLRFDPETNNIKGAGMTTYAATMTQRQLTTYAANARPDVPELKIALSEGVLNISAKPKVAGVGVKVAAKAGLHVENHRKLILDILNISAARVPAPGFAREYIESRLNPVFDSKDLGFDATMNRLKISRGSITIGGNLELTSLN